MKKVVFFGSSPHCVVTLDALESDERYSVVAVVTQPAKPVGRKQVVMPTAVESWALERGVEVLKPVSWKKDVSVAERARLMELGAEVGVLSNYGKILPQSVIDIFPRGIVNIHPSLLPLHRGPAPAVGAILSGEKISGTTIMLLSAQMDAGPVLGTVEIEVADDETAETYYQKGFGLGTQKLMEILPKYLDGLIAPIEQNHDKATYTKMLTRDDGRIDWTRSAVEIERQMRAYTPWPGIWTEEVYRSKGGLILSKEMAKKTGVVREIADGTFWGGQNEWQMTEIKKLRLKILSGQVWGEFFVPVEVQLAGEARQSWTDFTKRLLLA
jgi:methionyl-tRNA formyltransferase